MTRQSSDTRQHAVVIGGSFAGLLAARVLADHYERVTVLDHDVLPASRENRRGVPQARHTHGLLAGGRQALGRLFPGIASELIEAGALPGDIVRDTRWFIEGGCHAQFASGLDGLLMSRPFLESAVRERVRKMRTVVGMYRRDFDLLEQTMPSLKAKARLAGAGHWVQQEKPGEVNEHLLRFLSETGDRASSRVRRFGAAG